MGALEVSVLFVVAWCGICLALAHFGGWSALSRWYAQVSGFGGRRFHFRSARFGGWVGYNGALTIGADPVGMHLSVWPIFRVGHAPLFIPWSDVTVALEGQRWLAVVVLTFARSPGTTVRITHSLALRVAGESSGNFQPPAV